MLRLISRKLDFLIMRIIRFISYIAAFFAIAFCIGISAEIIGTNLAKTIINNKNITLGIIEKDSDIFYKINSSNINIKKFKNTELAKNFDIIITRDLSDLIVLSENDKLGVIDYAAIISPNVAKLANKIKILGLNNIIEITDRKDEKIYIAIRDCSGPIFKIKLLDILSEIIENLLIN
jgi:hypothetical protein